MIGLPSLPNLLSLSRIVLSPVIMVLLLLGDNNGSLFAAILFLFAALTDVVDGYLARKRGAVSTRGVFLDLAADKVLVAPLLVLMVFTGLLPAWIATVILVREIAVMAFRSYAAYEGLVIPADPWGKRKTVLTAMGIVAVLLADNFQRGGWLTHVEVLGNLLSLLAFPLMLLATTLTVFSGANYVRVALPRLKSRQDGVV
ncbi:MAG: CDP-diacylglycerol--glycerol-3-phosphate 3-phosphatidyltransferase [Chloroflexi bacterium]|nr:CDP-diacylglycerol--glycerol-3-phosphate 3-phosphatidyltransferase [Chloroflexota bacterium]